MLNKTLVEFSWILFNWTEEYWCFSTQSSYQYPYIVHKKGHMGIGEVPRYPPAYIISLERPPSLWSGPNLPTTPKKPKGNECKPGALVWWKLMAEHNEKGEQWQKGSLEEQGHANTVLPSLSLSLSHFLQDCSQCRSCLHAVGGGGGSKPIFWTESGLGEGGKKLCKIYRASEESSSSGTGRKALNFSFSFALIEVVKWPSAGVQMSWGWGCKGTHSLPSLTIRATGKSQERANAAFLMMWGPYLPMASDWPMPPPPATNLLNFHPSIHPSNQPHIHPYIYIYIYTNSSISLSMWKWLSYW